MGRTKLTLGWTLVGLVLFACGGDTTTPAATVASVVVSPSQISVEVLETVQLEASVRDASGASLTGRAVTWSSSDNTVATVSGSGLVTGVSEGTVTITATSEGVNGTAQVLATPARVVSVDVTPANGTVNENERVQLTATPRDQQGGALAGRTVSWSSSDGNIAMVDDAGLVIGIAGGSVTISATVEGQSGTASFEVTPPVDAVVESSNGELTLDIPAGALPPGIAAEDITISDVTDSPEFLVQSDGGPTVAILRLEPQGLEFSEPVVLTVRQLQVVDPGLQLFVLHVSGDDADVITDPVTEVDPVTNTLTASISVTHFSTFVYYVSEVFGDWVKAEITPPTSNIGFGETFDATVTASQSVLPGQLVREFTFDGPGISDPGAKWLFFMSTGPWTLTGRASGFRAVAPSNIDDVPASTSVAGLTFSQPVTFECTSGDIGGVSYSPLADFTLKKVSVSPRFGTKELDPVSQHAGDFESAIVNCDMPSIVAAAGPPLTTYTVSPAIPGATSPSFGWSGANCGSVTGSTTSTMVWNHGSEDCEHAGEAHPDAKISVLVTGTFVVSGLPYELRCEYTGAASGKGFLPCARIN